MSSRVAHWLSSALKGEKPKCLVASLPIIALVTEITGGLGARTPMEIVSPALCPLPFAVTVTVAVPVPVASRLNLTILSPGLSNWTDALAFPVIFSGPSTLMLTSAFLTPSSRAKTFTGITTFSPVPMTLGRVGRTISGDLTGTVFSALPYAPSLAATSITRTLPTYIGSLTLCVAEPLCSENGPMYLTTALNRLSFLAPTIRLSSPPMLNIGENLPL